MKQILALVCLLVLFGCTGNNTGEQDSVEQQGTDLEMNEQTVDDLENTRDFYLGLVSNPKNGKQATWDDIIKGYEEAEEVAEVTMIWVDPNSIGQCERLKQNRVIEGVEAYGLEPVITLSFATIKQSPGKGLEYVVDAPEGVEADLSDPGFRELWISEARCIAKEFKPKYFSLGNEINDYFYLHPEQLEDYLSLYDETHKTIKQESPETKVFVVFSYTHLIDNDQWDMVEQFDKRSDLIGLTSYPWKHFDNPEDIDSDYYERINQYTDKPIAFTEIGWISAKSAESSEKEQAEFLTKFLELTKNVDKEMINWLFLHEAELEGFVGAITEHETGTIALKNIDGSKKQVYDVWVELKNRRKI